MVSEKMNRGSFLHRSINESWKKCRNNSLFELFESGNYTSAAMKGVKDDFRTYAALGMIGKTDEALENLERFSGNEVRFYKGVIHWIAGDEKSAINLLDTVDSGHARRLLSMIDRRTIHVLSQFAWQEGHPNDFTAAAEKDRKFRIRNIGFDSRYIRNTACANISDLVPVDFSPDFYVTHMLEWHYLPVNLHELKCPKFGHTSDYDYCYHTSAPFLPVFDELIVSSGEEWEDVGTLSGRPVSTFPKSFSVPDFLEGIPSGRRSYDVLFSGSTIEPIFCEKARLIHEVASMDDVTIRLINGFLPMRDYYKALGDARLSLTYYRRPGGTVTRGLDALAMGCAALVQPKSVLKLFLDERYGLFSYDFEKNDIRDTVKRILGRWEDGVAEGAQMGAAIIRHEFDKTRVVSQYLRFLSFLAAKPGKEDRSATNGRYLAQKRLVFSRGLPCPPEVRKHIREMSLKCVSKTGEGFSGYRSYIDAARECVMEIADRFAGSSNGNDPETSILMTYVRDIYKKGISNFPLALVLRFNAIRAGIHFGNPGDVSWALALAKETLEMKAEWLIDAEDDVFPWDFLRFYFDYKTCFDLTLVGLSEKLNADEGLVRVIRASLFNYLSFYENSVMNAREAFSLNPEFPFYGLRLAALLSAEPGESEMIEANHLLNDLADHSYLFREAYALFVKNCGNPLRSGSWPDERLKRKMKKLNDQFNGKPGFEGFGQFVSVRRIPGTVNLEMARNGEKDHVE